MVAYLHDPRLYIKQDNDLRDAELHPLTIPGMSFEVYRYSQIHGARGIAYGVDEFTFDAEFDFGEWGYRHYTVEYRLDIIINDPTAYPPSEQNKRETLARTTNVDDYAFNFDVKRLNPIHVLRRTPVTVQLVVVQINRVDYWGEEAEDEDHINEVGILATPVITLNPTIPRTPIPDFWATPWEGDAPLDVQFDDRTIAEVIDSWLWDFGDGTTSTEQHPFHIFTEPGIYYTRLTASNRGGTDTITGVIDVYEPCRDPYGKLNSVTCMGYDRYRCVNSEWKMIVAESPECGYPAPDASFEASTYRGPAPLTVMFTDTSEPEPTSWLWDFGDGTTSTLKNVTHTYTQPGLWVVRLFVSNQSGTTTTTRLIDVTEPVPAEEEPPADEEPLTCANPFGESGDISCIGTSRSVCIDGEWVVVEPYSRECGAVTPVAAFRMNPAAGPAPLTVQFTDTSTGGGVAWAWSFGDGATSNEQNPTHTYTNPGTYRVKLVVANAIGNSSATGEVMVVEEGGSGTDSSLLSTLSELLSDRKIQILIAGGTILVLVGMASR